jgi:uncharacterized protein (TIGR02217 family)
VGFHDVRLPETFSEGSTFGPGFRTQIIELDSMAEHRIQRAPPGGRRVYNVTRGIADLDSLLTLYTFYVARSGAANTFRHKDWLDYATNASRTTHRGTDVPVAFDDEDLVLVSGSVWQMVSRYVSGPTTITRTIRKPVNGTVLIGDATGLRSSGFTIDYATGRVTFSSLTGTPTWGGEFDVPVRFDEQTDRAFQVGIEALNTGNLPEVILIEDIDPVVVSQDFPFGGAYDHGDIGADVQVSELNGRVQRFAPTTTGKSALLPVTTNLPTGAPYFFLTNDGTQTVTIKDSGGSTLTTIVAGASKIFWLSLVSTTKTWRFL